jgi:hypothetical protein
MPEPRSAEHQNSADFTQSDLVELKIQEKLGQQEVSQG